MDLILWRHADAEDGNENIDDLVRVLTPRGVKQAARVASWLDRQLPEGTRVLTSPARRCEQTALALGRKYKVRPELTTDTTVEQLLERERALQVRAQLSQLDSKALAELGLSTREITELFSKLSPKGVPDFELDLASARSAETFAEEFAQAVPSVDKPKH